MISKWLSANEIASLMGITSRGLRKRADIENWLSLNQKANGGIRRIYQLAALPEDIQRAYAESLSISLDELQGALKPASICEKKVVLANYNGRKEGGGEPPPLETANDKKRRTAKLRAKVIHAWDATG